MTTPVKKGKINPKIQKTVYKLDFNGLYSKFYDPNTYLDLAFCTTPSKNKIVTQITPYTSCRETLVGYLFKQFTPAAPNEMPYCDSSKCNILISKTVLMVRKHIPSLIDEWSNETKSKDTCEKTIKKVRRPFEQRILKGLKILNTLERKHGWPETKIYMLENKSPKKGNREQGVTCLTYMIIGSNKWIIAAPMLSLFTLILRSGGNITGDFNSYVGMMRMIQGGTKTARAGDRYHIRVTYKDWSLIMANYNKLFRGFKIKANYDKSKVIRVRSGILCHDGITSLCKGNCVNKILFERFNTIEKEVK